MPLPLDLSTADQEGVLQVSKGRKLPLLIDSEEMVHLFETLPNFALYDVSRPVTENEVMIPKEKFLKKYEEYIEGIKNGTLVEEQSLRPYFSAVMSMTPKALYAQLLPNGKYLVKGRKPLVQLQRHHFIYTDTFHSGVMGEGSITWGIQFSYPQLYLDPKTHQIGKVENNGQFPNTELFGWLAKWVREYTIPTPFLINDRKVNQPMRLGKKCLGWINTHPMLKIRGIKVESRKNSHLSH